MVVLYQGPEIRFSFAANFAKMFLGRLEAPEMPHTPAGTQVLSQNDNPVLLNPLFPRKTLNHSGLTWPRTPDVAFCKTCHHHSQVSKKLLERSKIPPGTVGNIWPTLLPPLTSLCLSVNSPGKEGQKIQKYKFWLLLKPRNFCP